ncbi:DUF262 domain-containing protein [Tenacibaculum sp. SDUM215027]|uniref:DUF262 domain-containing protein n=1 Tax=Tenacibaculum sp. SDUM215027 TaxID=3422596 RepID=UPI003D31CB39
MKRQPSVQDISWFIDLDNRGQLDLNPPYQRRSVWTSSDRKYFLDTIFRNYPCPPIFIHKTINDEGVVTYHVVDGKQRIETILLFAKNKVAIDKDFGDVRLDGLRFNKLDPEMKKIFWNYNVPVDFMDIDGLDINEVFDRVNRNSRNLERQELRHARYDGWFINLVEGEADDDIFWEKIKVTSKAKAKRMKNVQLVSELFLIILENKIVGFDQDYLDEKYAQFDSIEEDGEFLIDVDRFNIVKEQVKESIIKIEEHNKAITEKAKTNYNLYTLFALLILEGVEKVNLFDLADKYSSFMDLVDEFRKSDDPDRLLKDKDQVEHSQEAYRYYRATRGANTDLPQRKERLEALKTAVL